MALNNLKYKHLMPLHVKGLRKEVQPVKLLLHQSPIVLLGDQELDSDRYDGHVCVC